MESNQLGIDGAFYFRTKVLGDERGNFREWFKTSALKELGISFTPEQGNFSISKKNVLRGIHYSISSKGQSKLVMVAKGKITDVIVDLRESSPTFLKVIKIDMSEANGDILYIPEGVGHSFITHSDEALVIYLTSSEYDDKAEKTISPFDPNLAIDWGTNKDLLVLSERDGSAPSFEAMRAAGSLPQ